MQDVDQQGAEPGIDENFWTAAGGRDEDGERDQCEHGDAGQDEISRDLLAGPADMMIARHQREKQVGQDDAGDFPDWPRTGCPGPENVTQQRRFNGEEQQVEEGVTGIGMAQHRPTF